jgi:hypothetical protein
VIATLLLHTAHWPLRSQTGLKYRIKRLPLNLDKIVSGRKVRVRVREQERCPLSCFFLTPLPLLQCGSLKTASASVLCIAFPIWNLHLLLQGDDPVWLSTGISLLLYDKTSAKGTKAKSPLFGGLGIRIFWGCLNISLAEDQMELSLWFCALCVCHCSGDSWSCQISQLTALQRTTGLDSSVSQVQT